MRFQGIRHARTYAVRNIPILITVSIFHASSLTNVNIFIPTKTKTSTKICTRLFLISPLYLPPWSHLILASIIITNIYQKRQIFYNCHSPLIINSLFINVLHSVPCTHTCKALLPISCNFRSIDEILRNSPRDLFS